MKQKIKAILVLVTIVVFNAFDFYAQDDHPEYTILQGGDIEAYRMQVANGEREAENLLKLKELRLDTEVVSPEIIEGIKALLPQHAEVKSAKYGFSLITEKSTLKEEYAIVKKYLFDNGIKVLSTSEYYCYAN